MSFLNAQNRDPAPPLQVWAGLTAECQARVIQFLAHLAANFLTQVSVPTPRRSPDVDTVPHPEDPTPSPRASRPDLRPSIHWDPSARAPRQRRSAVRSGPPRTRLGMASGADPGHR